MRIAISSKSGCGNTTVTTLLAEKLGYKMVNFTFRQLAAERGVDFWTFCRMAEADDDIDRELDRRQVEMAMAEENCVLGSRLAIWMLEKADLKVYLQATSETRAKRVLKREGGSLEERMAQTEMRDRNDSARYKRIYGIDNSDTSVADLVIDTDDRTPEEIVELISEKLSTLR
ncbi:MAG: AAA family ATPase [Bullifex sp.]|nr:AAA family ATPase [Spirochaetales bacterium]MDY2815466.1 AAA family ATPase [Bullifex sp.]MDD7007511.1 AAA family ATPase [Spirochaetales bacterium]MDD7536423.1 AAA family ATPase [Spirochaetales bacterium]MDY4799786.1 AAA family ATPase [Bullifex sp.]